MNRLLPAACCLLPVACLWLAACGHAERSPAHPVPDASPSPAPAPAPPPTPAPDELPVVTWRWEGEDPGFGRSFYRGPIAIEDPGGMQCSFTYDDARHRESFECRDAPGRRRWGWSLGGAFMEDAALARQGDTVVLARFSDIATGCEVAAFRIDTGRERWRTRLLGAGPVSHSEYLNEVQVSIVDGRPVVFGWESASRYVEVLDPATGATLSNRRSENGTTWSPPERPAATAPRPDPPSPGAAAEVRWAWSGAPLGVGSIQVGQPVAATEPQGGRCTFLFDSAAQTTRLDCADRAGAATWSRTEGDQMMAGAALGIAGDRLVVVRFIPMATGASATAYDRATGREQWRAPLRGLGPISHSGYMNDVRVRVVGDRIVVYGWEAGGRYVEVLDLATGRTLGTRIVTDRE